MSEKVTYSKEFVLCRRHFRNEYWEMYLSIYDFIVGKKTSPICKL